MADWRESQLMRSEFEEQKGTWGAVGVAHLVAWLPSMLQKPQKLVMVHPCNPSTQKLEAGGSDVQDWA